SIERKWQDYWQQHNLFRVDRREDRDKFYYLDMYPYPSGDLHMGHVRNYIIGDAFARYRTMQGYNVLHPMGWDALGLPTENAAIKYDMHPVQWTEQCVANMKGQLQRLGVSYDWSREIDTSDPEYYGWTQWLFLQLYKNDLAYRGPGLVNWCPDCATVLANEQVVGACCERCDATVERTTREQWFFRITDYAERLLEDLELLDKWPERVVKMQEHWIGKSEGFSFTLQVEGHDEEMEVFTTRIDTVYGVTFMVLAPEHSLVQTLTEGTEYEEPVAEFCQRAMAESVIERTSDETEKHGIFTGAYAKHPLSGERIPIWVANYVMMDYGTGAIMAVPAHDERDFEFARKYDIAIVPVIQPEGEDFDGETMSEAFIGDGEQINSGEFSGRPNRDALEQIADHMEQEGIGHRDVNYRLRDWCISRQRYWGAPIPVIYCDRCGTVPVPEEDLPVELPEDADFSVTGNAPLSRVDEFMNVECPDCGAPARREADTMDTFVYSAWYYLRYPSPHEDSAPFVKDDVEYWLPVDQYVGGIEHATGHLMYSRFITKVLHDLGWVSFREPFASLFTQGMVYKDGAKMSKSRGNVVSPDALNDEYGTDTGRLYSLFVGPPDQDTEWSDEGVVGAHRFLWRVWRLVTENTDGWDEQFAGALPEDGTEAQREMRRKTHQTIMKVSDDFEGMHFNTAIAAIMELSNELGDFVGSMDVEDAADRAVFSEGLHAMVMLLSPITPHICDELWVRMGQEPSLFERDWPEADESLAEEESITIVVQVNGKVRDNIDVPAGTDMDDAVEMALEREKVAKYVEGKEIAKTIKVPDKLINLVVK
ncbi:MAG: leucine--tRNA ligase, partial [Armatimonadia bacterium]|nr:leucine--tRNA ligase [Armatimonadia bacterium]